MRKILVGAVALMLIATLGGCATEPEKETAPTPTSSQPSATETPTPEATPSASTSPTPDPTPTTDEEAGMALKEAQKLWLEIVAADYGADSYESWVDLTEDQRMGTALLMVRKELDWTGATIAGVSPGICEDLSDTSIDQEVAWLAKPSSWANIELRQSALLVTGAVVGWCPERWVDQN